MLTITSESYDDLTEEEQDNQPDNGDGKEYASYLRVMSNGKTLTIHSDAMEPEDCRFYRDLSWIKGSIEEAYELGKWEASLEHKQAKENQ